MGNGTRLTRSKSYRAVKRAVTLARSKRNYVEDLAAGSAAGLLNLTQRRAWLLPAFIVGLIATGVVWFTALRFPYAAFDILSNGFGSNLPSRYSTLLTVLVMLVPFAPPFISLFALGHMLWPVPPESEIARGVMSSFEHSQTAGKQWLIFMAAGMGGGLNCIVLLIGISSATGR
jgi:hypothetical protein